MEKPHRRLEVWEWSVQLAEMVYEMTREFPREEKFGLVSQMRRAAVSIPSNIAEGAARTTKPDFIRFLTIAIGSLSELDTQLELSHRLKYCSDERFQKIDKHQASVSRMLIALRKSIQEVSREEGESVSRNAR